MKFNEAKERKRERERDFFKYFCIGYLKEQMYFFIEKKEALKMKL